MFERFDRGLCNFLWEFIAPNTSLFHLHRIKSDHRPLAIRLGVKVRSSPLCPFRFINGCLSHSGFHHMVENNWTYFKQLEETLLGFLMAAKKWNVEVFGNILKKK